MKKITSFLSKILLLSVLLIPAVIQADGILIMKTPKKDGGLSSFNWNYSEETNQEAFINYQNGFQKMIISVGMEEDEEYEKFWIFPVPAKPEGVAIDILKKLPVLEGYDILDDAKIKMEKETERFLSYNTLFPMNIFTNTFGGLSTKGTLFSPMGFYSEGVEIHEHIEKEGLISEIITARTAESLSNYLKNMGISLEEKSIPVLDNYIGQDYSFIVSWINPDATDKEEVDSGEGSLSEADLEEEEDDWYWKPEGGGFFGYYPKEENKKSGKQVGVFVTFPTETMYFPLLPTSVYESKIVPVTVRVIGYVSPEIFNNIKNYTEVEYYREKHSKLSTQAKSFYNGGDDVKYTKIEINSPSKYLTEDLWIKNKAPFKISFFGFVGENSFLWLLSIMLVSSVLSGLLLSFIFFKGMEKRRLKTIGISLFNLLTGVGLMIKLLFFRTRDEEKDPELERALGELKEKKYILRRSPFLPSIFLVFFFGQALGFYLNNYVLFFSVIGLFLAATFFFFKRVKKEDKELFRTLKEKGYSKWTFLPKDKSKISFFFASRVLYFIIVFSWFKIFFQLLS